MFFLMRACEFISTINVIARPVCEGCGARMWLSRIEPDKPDHDRRIFECAECNNEKIVVVKYR